MLELGLLSSSVGNPRSETDKLDRIVTLPPNHENVTPDNDRPESPFMWRVEGASSTSASSVRLSSSPWAARVPRRVVSAGGLYVMAGCGRFLCGSSMARPGARCYVLRGVIRDRSILLGEDLPSVSLSRLKSAGVKALQQVWLPVPRLCLVSQGLEHVIASTAHESG